MYQLIKITKALSDKNRIAILKLLENKPLCVCELQAALEIAQPTVSSHLRVLQEAGLIKHHKDGRWIIYRFEKIENIHLAQLVSGVLDYLKLDKEINKLLAKLEKTDRHEICKAKGV